VCQQVTSFTCSPHILMHNRMSLYLNFCEFVDTVCIVFGRVSVMLHCLSVCPVYLGKLVLCDCCIFRFLSHFLHVLAKCAYCIFLHKLAFSTAILTLFVFILPISVRFRYLDCPVAKRMATPMCLEPLWNEIGIISFKQFCTYYISAYLLFVWPHIF